MLPVLDLLQEWELSEDDRGGELEYPTKYSKFGSVSNVTLHFPANFGAGRASALGWFAFRPSLSLPFHSLLQPVS